MNGAFNRVDKNMLYLLQQGVPEWCETVKYPANAIIKYNGVLYTAIAENDNSNPATSTTKWKKTQEKIANASTSQIGVVKLSSSTNSTSETEAATSLAVKYAYDLAGQAKWHATNNAAQKTQKINGKQLHGDISLSAADVGALSKSDFNTRIGNPGFEIMPSGLIRQWGTVQLPPVGDYNAVIINGTKYYTNYHQILLPIAFPHNSDSVNVTMACGTMDLQSVMFGTFATANLNGSPSRFTVAITTPVLGASLTVHYEIIGH
ncbi:tail fiber protein [Gilliamella sp. Pra-s65]|uniref:tail fiber protein n=1 Tax=Gilliamella sp. Pra-s65 TaxID=2687316 RepID=UPI0013655643|nr:tail fiber protein [Gilliamella sp. Pra-s65]